MSKNFLKPTSENGERGSQKWDRKIINPQEICKTSDKVLTPRNFHHSKVLLNFGHDFRRDFILRLIVTN